MIKVKKRVFLGAICLALLGSGSVAFAADEVATPVSEVASPEPMTAVDMGTMVRTVPKPIKESAALKLARAAVKRSNAYFDKKGSSYYIVNKDYISGGPNGKTKVSFKRDKSGLVYVTADWGNQLGYYNNGETYINTSMAGSYTEAMKAAGLDVDHKWAIYSKESNIDFFNQIVDSMRYASFWSYNLDYIASSKLIGKKGSEVITLTSKSDPSSTTKFHHEFIIKLIKGLISEVTVYDIESKAKSLNSKIYVKYGGFSVTMPTGPYVDIYGYTHTEDYLRKDNEHYLSGTIEMIYLDAMDRVKLAGEGAILDQATLALSIDHFNYLANIVQYGLAVEMSISDTGYNFVICGHIEGDKRIYEAKSCSEAGFTKS